MAPEIIGFEPALYTLTAEYGAALEALGLPAEVTALLSDGTTAQLAVVWTRVGDGLGGTVYIPEHENPLEAAYTFQAADGRLRLSRCAVHGHDDLRRAVAHVHGQWRGAGRHDFELSV